MKNNIKMNNIIYTINYSINCSINYRIAMTNNVIKYITFVSATLDGEKLYTIKFYLPLNVTKLATAINRILFREKLYGDDAINLTKFSVECDLNYGQLSQLREYFSNYNITIIDNSIIFMIKSSL